MNETSETGNSAEEHEIDRHLLAFPINVRSVLKHLRQDMRDDWFVDALEYAEIFDAPKNLVSVVQAILSENNGQYQSGGRFAYDIPKTNLGLRYALETDFYDRFIYQAIASYLIPFYDPLLSNRVLGHRFNSEYRSEKYIFKHRIELWNTFQGMTKLALDSDDALLVTDLINYFENITVDSIINALVDNLPNVTASGIEKNRIRNAIHTLESLLNKWCYSERHGLPQNRDASSFLANIVLNKVDRKMVAMGYDYFRYVDDIRIICKDENHARQALNNLIRELRTVGLNINSSKTTVLTKQSTADQVNDYFPSYDDRILAIDNMWKSRSRRVIARSIPLIQQLLNDLVTNGQSQSRQFRFCINRLQTMIQSGVFDCSSILTPTVEKILLDQLYSQPASTDFFCKILTSMKPGSAIFSKVERFLLNSGLSIHSWQNFNLWMMLATVGHNSSLLVEKAKSQIMRDILAADVPAMFIYLGKLGNTDAIAELIPYFSENWPYQHRRFFLVAAQNIDGIQLRPLIEKLGPRLEGTLKRIRENKGITNPFLHRTQPGNVLDIFNRVSPYD